MVAVRVPRFAAEVLVTSDPRQQINRIDVEVLTAEDGSSAVRVPRFAMEVLETRARQQQINRIDIEVLTGEDGTNTVQVPRFAMEVLETVPRRQQINRIDVEVLTNEAGTSAVQVPRFAIEVLTRSGAGIGDLLPYPTGLDYYRHNWSQRATVETSYSTDVTESQRTLAEDRTGLLEKPNRLLGALWSGTDRTTLDRLYVTLRRMTEDRTAAPLYADMTCVSATSASAQTSLWCDTRWRRFFVGGRVVIFPVTSPRTVMAADAKVYVIQQVQTDRLILTTNLNETWAAGAGLVFPLLSTDFVLDPELEHLSSGVARVGIELREILGDSSLPPIQTGFPEGFTEADNMPVLAIPQDWTGGLSTQYVRAGERYGSGRSHRTYRRGARYYQVQEHACVFPSREAYWRLLRLFDSRRGRLRPFVAIDQEAIWEVASVSTTFIDVLPLGLFADFEKAMPYFGIAMKDGTAHARRVNTIQDLGGTWRITTVGPNWPSLTLANIDRAARARVSRFESDALREEWDTLEVVRARFTVRELLAERESTMEP